MHVHNHHLKQSNAPVIGSSELSQMSHVITSHANDCSRSHTVHTTMVMLGGCDALRCASLLVRPH